VAARLTTAAAARCAQKKRLASLLTASLNLNSGNF
jgi:hypothetical protein